MLRRVTVVVCVFVKSHLTSGASVRPENAVTYSVGNRGQNNLSRTQWVTEVKTICVVFSATA